MILKPWKGGIFEIVTLKFSITFCTYNPVIDLNTLKFNPGLWEYKYCKPQLQEIPKTSRFSSISNYILLIWRQINHINHHLNVYCFDEKSMFRNCTGLQIKVADNTLGSESVPQW